jgi:hypothetical protein
VTDGAVRRRLPLVGGRWERWVDWWHDHDGAVFAALTLITMILTGNDY